MLKRFILWDFPRATWQYDVMVGIILAFIFLTPRDWFRDQPRVPQASAVTMLPSEHGADVFWIEPELLDGVPEAQQAARLGEVLGSTAKKRINVVRVEPIYNSENEIKGYMAFAKP